MVRPGVHGEATTSSLVFTAHSAQRRAVAAATAHTAFALPGWNPGLPSEEPGCAVVMFSTCHFLLDFIRLQRFYDTNSRRGVNLQIDHLFKVS
jgi:hypothetical protein